MEEIYNDLRSFFIVTGKRFSEKKNVTYNFRYITIYLHILTELLTSFYLVKTTKPADALF